MVPDEFRRKFLRSVLNVAQCHHCATTVCCTDGERIRRQFLPGGADEPLEVIRNFLRVLDCSFDGGFAKHKLIALVVETNVGWCSTVAMFVGQHDWLTIEANDCGGGIRSPQIDGALQHHEYHNGEMVQMVLTCNGRWQEHSSPATS
jgi:hypothetical protein